MHISSRSKVNILLSLLVISSAYLALLISAKSSAQAAGSHLSLSPNYGHPSASIKVAGKRFGTSETISIMFDATSVGTATTSSTGAFSTSIIIPSLALPGTHTIRATGTTSGLTASASFLVRTDWTLFGFDANHTNVNPYENVLSPTNVSHLTLDWSMTTGGAIVSEPAVVKDVVYIGSADHNFYALNANTGAVLWTATTDGGIVWSSPAVANGIVYVGSGDDKLYAFNANTGAIVWTASTGGSIESSPTVAKGIVYVGSSDNKLYAFNALTGATVWVASIGNISSPYSPVVASSLVLLGSDTHMYAFNAKTGAIVWSTPANNNLYINSYPVVANGEVYVTVGNGTGYNEVDGFNSVTGTFNWEFAVNYIDTAPVIIYQTMFLGIGNELAAIDMNTRTITWGKGGLGWIAAVPTVANGVVYASDEEGNEYAFDASNGAELWITSLSPGFEIQSSAVVVNGIFYIGSNDHHIYAFHLPGTTS